MQTLFIRLLYISIILTISLFSYQNRIKILQKISFDGIKFKGYEFSEISGATYDSKERILYLVSDKGILFKFRAEFTDRVYLKKLSATYLKDRRGRVLRHWKRDSEGIALDNRGNLFISFEGKPKIAQFTKDGVMVRKLKLPKSIRKAKYRSRNKTLESLAFHPKYGLLTAFEYSVKPYKRWEQIIYSLRGRKWRVNLEKFKNVAITELEYFKGDEILILERAYNGIFGNFVITLKRFNLKTKRSRVIYNIQSANQDSIENFEALAKVGANRFIMISDDNDNIFASTLLVYFEVLDR